MTHDEALKRWIAVEDYLNREFDRPDLLPLRVGLAQYAAHFQILEPPVWSFMLGAPGSGKSSIVIRALEYLHNVESIDVLNKNSFLSGWGRNFGILGSDNGLAQISVGPSSVQDKISKTHGIIVFSDFSTFLELNKEEKALLQAEMRRIFDGRLKRPVGNKKGNEQPVWEGKITLIAACTNALEDYWTLSKDLGERFVLCRMRERTKAERRRMAQIATGRIGRGGERHDEKYQVLIKRFMGQIEGEEEGFAPVEQVGTDNSGLFDLCELITRARARVNREYGKIEGVERAEMPTRIAQTLVMIAIGNASLMRREQTTERDFRLAMSVGLNTIPEQRLWILDTLTRCRDNGYRCSQWWLEHKLFSSHGRYFRTKEDLEALGLITQECEGAGEVYLTDEGIELCEAVRLDYLVDTLKAMQSG